MEIGNDKITKIPMQSQWRNSYGGCHYESTCPYLTHLELFQFCFPGANNRQLLTALTP